jgi:hypothetical protein
VAEDLQAQVGQCALANPSDEIGLRVRRRPDHERAGDEGDHHQVQRAAIALEDARVDGRLGQRRGRQRSRGSGHQREEHEHDARPVGREEHHEPAQLSPAAPGADQAPAQVVAPGGGAGGLVSGRHSPAT